MKLKGLCYGFLKRKRLPFRDQPDKILKLHNSVQKPKNFSYLITYHL